MAILSIEHLSKEFYIHNAQKRIRSCQDITLRLNLAHTMVKQPRLMLLDEPTASLDNKTKVLVKDMLMQLKEKGKSMVGIFHDLEFMDGLCDKVFNISEGTLQ